MSVRFNRLNHVQVCIPPGGEERARQFYGGVLGLREIEKPAVLRPSGGMWYEVADIQLHIGVENAATAPSKRHPAFEVEDAAGVRRYLEARGVQTKDEEDVPGIRQRFSCFDPFGNRIELMERTES